MLSHFWLSYGTHLLSLAQKMPVSLQNMSILIKFIYWCGVEYRKWLTLILKSGLQEDYKMQNNRVPPDMASG